MGKPFKEWGIVKFLSKKLPSAVGDVADVALGSSPVGTLIKTILGKDELSAEDKEIALAKLADDLQREKLAVQDRESAREREIKLTKLKGLGVYVQNISAIIVVLAFILTLAGVIFYEIPDGNGDIIYYVIGGLMSTISMIFSYWYGSSAKDDNQDREAFLKGLRNE